MGHEGIPGDAGIDPSDRLSNPQHVGRMPLKTTKAFRRMQREYSGLAQCLECARCDTSLSLALRRFFKQNRTDIVYRTEEVIDNGHGFPPLSLRHANTLPLISWMSICIVHSNQT